MYLEEIVKPFINLVLAISVIIPTCYGLACIRPGICKNEATGEHFDCRIVGRECCTLPNGGFQLFEAPRGTACCHGSGMFNVQTHKCEGGEVVVRGETTTCPSSSVLYNPTSQTCCRKHSDSNPTVHMAERGGACCGSDYIVRSIQGCCNEVPYDKESQCCKDLKVKPKTSCDSNDIENAETISCHASEGFCRGETSGDIFPCIERQYECCSLPDNTLQLFSAPRGRSCCQGVGMFHTQTHDCAHGQIVAKPETQLCPKSTDTYYNRETQTCCYGKEGQPSVHMKEKDYSCCGSAYIRDSSVGCCDGVPFDKETKCCKNNAVYRKEECERQYHSDCPLIDCSLNDDLKLNSQKRKDALYAYLIMAGRFVNSDSEYNYYKITQAKQLKGIKRGKVSPVSSRRMRRIGVPKCSCFTKIKRGKHYMLLIKSRMRSNILRLQKGKSTVTEIENSAAISKLFDL